ncbi:MAG TPA: DUF4386 domain-containing protein [Propionicimonas sp.]|nr:DUF4386 domain-containing protein [Propionicimonas sp.]
MTTSRRIALWGGMLYLATFVTSIPALALKTSFFAGTGGRSAGAWGVVLELLLAASCVGTAVALYPATRRVSQTLGLGFVLSRTLEAAMIMVGVLAVLATATVRAQGSDSVAELVALHDASFLIGPAVMSAVNALLLGSVMYRSRLVPRLIPAFGLVGAPLLLASSVGVLLGVWTQTSTIASIATVPVAMWELSLGLWLVIRGFRAEAVARLRLDEATASDLVQPVGPTSAVAEKSITA